jgi:four helix bundle protein
LYRIKLSRKEGKETDHWLQLIQEANPDLENRLQDLFTECRELRNIFSSIINKIQKTD